MRWIVDCHVLKKFGTRLKWQKEFPIVEAPDGNKAAKAGCAEVARLNPDLRQIKCTGVRPAPPVLLTKDDLAAPKLMLRARTA